MRPVRLLLLPPSSGAMLLGIARADAWHRVHADQVWHTGASAAREQGALRSAWEPRVRQGYGRAFWIAGQLGPVAALTGRCHLVAFILGKCLIVQLRCPRG